MRVREATTADEHEEETIVRMSKENGEAQRCPQPQSAAQTMHASGEYAVQNWRGPLAREIGRRPTRLFPSQQIAEIVTSESAFAKRLRMPLSVVCLGLGSVDTDGNDFAIWQVADWLIRHLRQEDLVIEANADSLMLVLRATNLEGACSLAARVRRLAAAEPMLVAASPLDLRAGCASLRCALHDAGALVLLAQRRFLLARNCEPHPVVGKPILLVTPSNGSAARAEPDALARLVGCTAPVTHGLPTELQVVLALRLQLDCSFEQIAVFLETSERTARKLYARALQELGDPFF